LWETNSTKLHRSIKSCNIVAVGLIPIWPRETRPYPRANKSVQSQSTAMGRGQQSSEQENPRHCRMCSGERKRTEMLHVMQIGKLLFPLQNSCILPDQSKLTRMPSDMI
ncbi:hypothetical protein TNCV_1200981, partial [Trichonephila clavipes]